MKKLLTIALVLASSLSFSASQQGEDLCAMLIDGSREEHYFYETWVNGFLAGRMKYAPTSDQEKSFYNKVWGICSASPEITIRSSSSIAFISGGNYEAY